MVSVISSPCFVIINKFLMTTGLHSFTIVFAVKNKPRVVFRVYTCPALLLSYSYICANMVRTCLHIIPSICQHTVTMYTSRRVVYAAGIHCWLCKQHPPCTYHALSLQRSRNASSCIVTSTVSHNSWHVHILHVMSCYVMYTVTSVV